MTVDASPMTPPISRRAMLRRAASATVGLAGILATKTSPLYAATRTVTTLQAKTVSIESRSAPFQWLSRMPQQRSRGLYWL